MFDFSRNQYYSDLRQIGTELLPEGKMSILVTGSTGLIGSCMVDALIYANEQLNGNIEIYALSRSRQRIQQRFGSFVEKAYFHIVEQDVQAACWISCRRWITWWVRQAMRIPGHTRNSRSKLFRQMFWAHII